MMKVVFPVATSVQVFSDFEHRDGKEDCTRCGLPGLRRSGGRIASMRLARGRSSSSVNIVGGHDVCEDAGADDDGDVDDVHRNDDVDIDGRWFINSLPCL